MQKKICEICNSEFEGRENQKYCSDACKQKAYKHRKTGTTIIQKSEIKILGSFKMSEFKKLVDKFNEPIFNDFVIFCFFRKNYKLPFEVKNFLEYIDSFNEDIFTKIDNLETPEGQAFKEFKKLYHLGHYEVIE